LPSKRCTPIGWLDFIGTATSKGIGANYGSQSRILVLILNSGAILYRISFLTCATAKRFCNEVPFLDFSEGAGFSGLCDKMPELF